LAVVVPGRIDCGFAVGISFHLSREIEGLPQTGLEGLLSGPA